VREWVGNGAAYGAELRREWGYVGGEGKHAVHAVDESVRWARVGRYGVCAVVLAGALYTRTTRWGPTRSRAAVGSVHPCPRT
jgi:hypothetical protein